MITTLSIIVGVFLTVAAAVLLHSAINAPEGEETTTGFHFAVKVKRANARRRAHVDHSAALAPSLAGGRHLHTT